MLLSHRFNFRAKFLAMIGRQAVRAAQKENRRLGIPSAHAKNGEMYYRLPNGEISREDPF